MKNSSLFVWMIFVLLSLTGCELTDEIEEVSKKSVALEALAEYSIVSKHFNSASNTSGGGVALAENSQAMVSLKNFNVQPHITVKPVGDSAFPVLITVDFGTGIKGDDGITRKGKLHIESTDWYQNEHSIHVTSFEDYYQDDYQIEGLHIEINNGPNEDGLYEYDVEIENGKLTTPDGKSITYTQHTTRTWLKGASTPLNFIDDEYLIEGNQTGVSSKGVGYALQIVTPLHLVVYPWEIKDGDMIVNVDGLNGIELNYTTKKIIIGGMVYSL